MPVISVGLRYKHNHFSSKIRAFTKPRTPGKQSRHWVTGSCYNDRHMTMLEIHYRVTLATGAWTIHQLLAKKAWVCVHKRLAYNSQPKSCKCIDRFPDYCRTSLIQIMSLIPKGSVHFYYILFTAGEHSGAVVQWGQWDSPGFKPMSRLGFSLCLSFPSQRHVR